jgi:hypothetical protein
MPGLGDGCPSERRRAAATGIKVKEIVRLKSHRPWIVGPGALLAPQDLLRRWPPCDGGSALSLFVPVSR